MTTKLMELRRAECCIGDIVIEAGAEEAPSVLKSNEIPYRSMLE